MARQRRRSWARLLKKIYEVDPWACPQCGGEFASDRLILREKHLLPDPAIVEMGLWQLPEMTTTYPHGIKYRLYYGLKDGRYMVRYDNESGKGDHRHYKNREEPYCFIDVETLVRDFLVDVAKARRSDR